MRNWIWGIAVIIVALLGCLLIPLIDNDPETKADVAGAIDGVKEGVDIIKTEDKVFEVGPGVGVIVEEKK